MEKIKIKEAIVVEGRDDKSVVSRACDALIIVTHGFGITKDTWKLIDKAYKEKGIVVLTDPDFSGEEIRKKIAEKYPNAKHAYIPREEANKDGDIGVENATPGDVVKAINKAHVAFEDSRMTDITDKDLEELGLTGAIGAARRRDLTATELGIGYSNGKTFLKRLNGFGITKTELEEAVRAFEQKK